MSSVVQVNSVKSKQEQEVYDLIFCLVEHEQLGVILEPFSVKISDKGDYTYTFKKVNGLTLNDYPYKQQLSKEVSACIDLIDEYADDILIKKFSKKKLKPREFYNNLDNELRKKHIRPYIEKRIGACLNLIEKNNFPLYKRNKKQDHPASEKIEIRSGKQKIVLAFNKLSEGVKYKLEAYSDNTAICLKDESSRLLSSQPCWILIQNEIIRFPDKVNGKRLVPFFKKEVVFIPKDKEETYFKTFIKNSVRDFEVKTEGFQVKEIAAQPRPKLILDRHFNGAPVFNLYFDYNNFHLPANEQDKLIINLQKSDKGYGFEKIKRNFKEEDRISDLLVKKGLQQSSGAGYTLAKEHLQTADNEPEDTLLELVNWMNENSEDLSGSGIEISQNVDVDYYSGNVSVELQVKERNDWFDIDGHVRLGTKRIPFIKLRNHILGGKREYELTDGTILILPKEWFVRYRDLFLFSEVEKNKLSVKKYHTSVVKRSVKGINNQYVQEFEKLKNLEKAPDISAPEGLLAKLRPYQLDGFRWMYMLQRKKLGACLADDMGLGKTLQTLTLILKTKNDREKSIGEDPAFQLDLFNEGERETNEPATKSSGIALAVMPSSLIHNWEDEAAKFTPSLRVYKHVGQRRVTDLSIFRNYDLILTTYGTVRNDLEGFKNFYFRHLILDESQIVKNPHSKTYKALKQVKAENRVVLTGTPIENSLTDLWSQLSFLNAGLLGDLSFFKQEFAAPIEKKSDTTKSERLKELVHPFILRRTKRQVAKDLPNLTEQIYFCEMPDEQCNIYEEEKSKVRNFILENINRIGIEKSQFVVLKGLIRLRQIACHPSLVKSDYEAGSGKFREVIRNIENIISEDHKVLIFSQFVKHLEIFRDYIENAGWNYSYLTGRVAQKERKEVVTSFQEDDNNKIFLISLKAGGVGLNLTAADYVFLLDPWWNPAVEAQAINRAHRIGQDKNVMAYRFITKESIEEKILKLQERKNALSNLFINTNNPFKSLTREDIEKLFD